MFCISWILIWIVVIAMAIKIYLKLSLRANGSYTCLVGKTAIVTGANTGIGYCTALDFAKRGARVILACRNEIKAEDAQRRITNATQNPNVIYKLVDFTSLESVRHFAEEINKTEERIDILVNNAGAGGLGKKVTSDGLEMTLQVNHISAFLLTHLLIDKIKMSAPSRIVNVSSILAKYTKLNMEKFNEQPSVGSPLINDLAAYCNSKLCNILFTIVLANKLRDTGVTVNTLHPGAVKTEIFRRTKGVVKVVLHTLINLYFKTAEEGAQTTIYVATSEKLNGVTGKLFDNCQKVSLYNTARSPTIAKAVWEKTEELAKLNSNEKIK